MLVVAKHDQSHLSLARQLKQRDNGPALVPALVHGRPSAVEGTISAPIGRHPVHRKRMAVSAEGRPATTYYRILEELGPYTLLQVQLSTGRTSDPCASPVPRHPVAGDQVYGRRTEPFTIEGQALHAATLRLLLSPDRSVDGVYRTAPLRFSTGACLLPEKMGKKLRFT